MTVQENVYRICHGVRHANWLVADSSCRPTLETSHRAALELELAVARRASNRLVGGLVFG